MSQSEPLSREQVLEEINSLTSELGVKCRVIENVGAFQFVVSMSCDRAPELGVKLQLTDKYPAEPPCVSVRAAPATEAALTDLAASLAGRPMLRTLAGCAFPATAQSPAVSLAQTAAEPGSQRRQREKRRTKRAEAEGAAAASAVTGTGKLKPMKTADDVIKRIQWDAGIPSSEVTIGYLDRFKGVMEKPFGEFSWEDIASVDYFTFVIPRHRICYFKYRRAIVWDKRRRLDLVFNSTYAAAFVDAAAAAPGDIYELIANYRDEDYPEGEASMASASSDSEHGADSGSGSGSDSDDGVHVHLDQRAVGLAAGQAAARHGGDEGDSQSDGEGGDGVGPGSDKFPGRSAVYWRDLLRPNFFICVRVTDPAAAAAVAALQAQLVAQQPAFQSCCIPPEMLHCTLVTLRLDNAEQVSACAGVLAAAGEELLASLPREPLRLRGTGCFFGRVLHARVSPPPAGLEDFVQHLQAVVRSAGFQVLETHEFVPHVTVMKTSRPVSRLLGSRLIPPRLYAGFEHTVYGEQPMNAIYLCSMEKARGPDGFYVAPGCVQFMRTVLQVPEAE